MTKLTDTQFGAAHHVCVFGDPKTGKSTLVSKLAEAGYNLIWVSLDNGHSVLYKLPHEAQERIELIRLPDTRDFPVGIATCLKIATGSKLTICDSHGQVDCSVCRRNKNEFWSTVYCREHDTNTIIVFDNISQLADSAMNFATEGKPDGYKSTYDDFRMQGFLMNKFLTDLQQASFHSICIAHVCETTMEDDGKKLVPWIGSVPFSRQAGKYFDHMVYLNVRNKKHIGGSSSTFDTRAVTGSRTDISIEDDKYKEFSLAPIIRSFIVRDSKAKEVQKIVEGVRKTVASISISSENEIEIKTGEIEDKIEVKEVKEEIKEEKEEKPVSNAKAALAMLALKGKR